ncbi:MAG: nucleotidyltransferase domain-containing protein [Candidatus Nanohalobium sp.]
MDKETVEKVKQKLEKTAEDKDLQLDKVLVFGSRASDDYREDSDIDLLIVSKDFEGVNWNKRPRHFYLNWDYDRLPEPEFICLTPQEFEDKKEEKPHIVRTAVDEGVSI